MKPSSSRSVVASCLTLLLALAAGSCALVGGSPEHIGGNATLGDAARAAHPDSSRKQRRLDVGDTVLPEGSVEVSSSESRSYDADEGEGPGSPDDPILGPNQRFTLGLVAGGGAMGGARYDGFGEYGLSIGLMDDRRWGFELVSVISPIQFADETLAGQSFKHEFDWNVDLVARYSLTPGHTFLGVGPLVGVRFGTLFWDFAKPVPIVEDGVPGTVESDYLNHFSTFVGLGLGLAQTRHMLLGGQVITGARFYSWGTHHGFSNTLFPSAGFMQGRVQAAYRF